MACASCLFQPSLNPATASRIAASSPLCAASSVAFVCGTLMVNGIPIVTISISTGQAGFLLAARVTLAVMFSAPGGKLPQVIIREDPVTGVIEMRARVAFLCGAVACVMCSSAMVAAQTPADTGRQVFVGRCAGCHGSDGNGGELGPGIATRMPARSDQELTTVIGQGLPAAGMPAFPSPPETAA